MVDDCRALLSTNVGSPPYQLKQYSYREANGVVDALARPVTNLGEDFVIFDASPFNILLLLKQDALGYVYLWR